VAADGGRIAGRHGGLLLIDLLRAHGVRHVFGLPGGQTMALYDGILERAPSIRHLLVRDERSGAYAADAYARVTGRVGVCDATVGPGAAKLPSGLGEALNASIPVLALVSDLPRRLAPMRYRGAASQALDQARLLEPVTKWLATVDDLAAMPDLVRRAFREATSGRPGPVALLLPQDVLDAPWAGGEAVPSARDARFGRCPSLRPWPDPADVDAAAAVLRAARRPLILAGGGALLSGATGALRALAERLSAAVATTLSGKGAFPEGHPLSVGVVGAMGTAAAATALAEADTVLLLGTKAGGNPTFGWTLPRADQAVVQLDVDPVELGRAFPLRAGLLADARAGLEALGQALQEPADPAAAAPDRGQWRARVAQLMAAWRAERDRERALDTRPIAPQRVLGELERALRPDDLVVCDASLASGWGGVYLEQRRAGRRVLSPRGLAGLGWALPAAIGVATALPGRRVVALMGDGALSYAVGELATVAEHGLAITAVVLNNRSLAWIRWYRRIAFGRGHEDEDFAEVDFAAVARAYRLEAARVEEPGELGRALEAALRAEGPALLDVRTEVWETPIAAHRRALEQGLPAAGYGT
jgi:acetolactate synthase-1/2/3 large subunit